MSKATRGRQSMQPQKGERKWITLSLQRETDLFLTHKVLPLLDELKVTCDAYMGDVAI